MTPLDQVNAWIRSRQSIYPPSFTGEHIPDDLINIILENANAAPSHRHTEPWRFHVITGSSLEQLAAFAQKQYTVAHKGADFKERKHDKIKKKLSLTSHLIVIGMQRDEKQSVPEWEEIASVACAVQNIHLSLNAANIGGYWSSPAYLLKNLGQFLDISPGERCLGLFYLGMPKEDLPPKVTKRPILEKMKWYS